MSGGNSLAHRPSSILPTGTLVLFPVLILGLFLTTGVAQDECPVPGTQISQVSQSTASLTLTVVGAGPTNVVVQGNVTTSAVVGADGGTVQTEIVSMTLTGESGLGTVTVRQSGVRRSTGTMTRISTIVTGGEQYCCN